MILSTNKKLMKKLFLSVGTSVRICTACTVILSLCSIKHRLSSNHGAIYTAYLAKKIALLECNLFQILIISTD
jgi:hypothetical protein